MQHTGLVLSLEKTALQAIRAELLTRHDKRNAKKGTTNNGGAFQVTASSMFSATSTSAAHHDTTVASTSTESDLTAVEFVDFVLALFLHMNILPFEKKSEYQQYTLSNGFFLQMVSIISVFDAVDVDSRGVISFTDFTNFCLRLGRLIFKPNVKRSMTVYLQSQDQKNISFPSSKMRFMSHSQLLLVFDSDTPRVRIYG